MLFLAIAWLLLLAVSFVVGAGFLHIVGDRSFQEPGDRLVVSSWLGVVFLCVALSATALIVPLSPIAAAAVAGGLVCLSVSSGRRAIVPGLRRAAPAKVALGLLGFMLGVSAVEVRFITHGDAGLYHIGAIRWLAQYGVVPGLALIHSRFGFSSSWFSLAAPWSAGPLQDRVFTLPGGLAFLLAGLHLAFCLARCSGPKGSANSEDWFAATALLAALPMIVVDQYLVSPTPDLPVTMLVILGAWSMVVIVKNERNRLRDRRKLVDARLVPLALAAGAATMKLSALPFLVVALCFYVSRKPLLGRSVVALSFCVLLLLPLLASNSVTSGFPLFPSPIIRLDLPWSLDSEEVRRLSEVITNWARWSGPTPVDASSWNWLPGWLLREKAVSLLMLMCLTAGLASPRCIADGLFQGYWWPFAVGSAGVVYMMLLAPTWRFGLGYVSVLAGVCVGLPCERWARDFGLMSRRHIASKEAVAASLLVASGLLVPFAAYARSKFFSRVDAAIDVAVKKGTLSADTNYLARMAIPPVVLNFQMNTRPDGSSTVSGLDAEDYTVNSIRYLVPKGAVCWGATLPCVPPDPMKLQAVALRDPAKGIAGGFARFSHALSNGVIGPRMGSN